MRALCLFGLCAALTVKAAAPDDVTQPLADRYPAPWLKSHLLSRDDFHPFPTAMEHEGWGAVDPDLRNSLIADGEKAAKGPWEVLPADVFLQYARNGNRSHYEALYDERRERTQKLALAELLEHKGRFLDQEVNGIWALCEETSWSLPAHMGGQKAGVGLPDATEPIIELFAAETAAQLAWTQYLQATELNTVSPLINDRITGEIERRIITPFLTRDDFGWMGAKGQHLNNWTTWITSNVITCLLLCEHDEARREAGLEKALVILDRYLKTQPADGGCEEGPGYWSVAAGSLFDSLDLLRQATHGSLDAFNTPKVQELEKYIYRLQIDGPWFVNFADAEAKPNANQGVFFYRIGERIDDPVMMRFGAAIAQEHKQALFHSQKHFGRYLADLVRRQDVMAADAGPALPRDAWFPDLQVMIARETAGSPQGLFLAAKGGHNSGGHTHNDIGSCVVFADGKPVLIDAGVDTYTKKTFSPQRYEIWTMQSAYHNLPSINGVMQHEGLEYAARDVRYTADDHTVIFSLDIAGAYPKEAHATTWIRTYAYNRDKEKLAITDDYALSQLTGPIERHFLLAVKPIEVSPGILQVDTVGGPKVEFKTDPACTVAIEAIDTADPRLHNVWGDRIYRLTYTETNSRIQDHLELNLRIIRSTAEAAP